jgi:hypothetical protein
MYILTFTYFHRPHVYYCVCLWTLYTYFSNFLDPPPQLESSLDARVSEPCAILTAAEEPEDFAIDPATSVPSSNSTASSSRTSSKASQAVCGHRRRWHWRHTKSGMRHLVEFPLLFPDAVVDPKFFGLTQRGALLNAPRCGSGNRWISTEGCRKSLTRVVSAYTHAKYY